MPRPRKDKSELVRATSLPFSFLRKNNAAKFLGVSIPTFNKYAKREDFPKAYQLDDNVRVYDSRDLSDWARSQEKVVA